MAKPDTVKVYIDQNWADKRGNVWRKHLQYDVSPETADMFVRKGIARLAVDVLVGRLAEHGGGLLILPGTDPELIEAARAAKLKLAKVAGGEAKPPEPPKKKAKK